MILRSNFAQWRKKTLSSKFRKGAMRLTTFLLLCLTIFVIYKRFIENSHQEYFLKFLKGPMRYDDPELLRYIKENVIDSPSSLPYNFTSSARESLIEGFKSEQFYNNITKLLFNEKERGFFVEAGALDGQAMSNTLVLERAKKWTGILIEPDPSNYVLLRSKHRKAWTANACISLYDYPKMERMSSFDIVSSISDFKDVRHRSMGSIIRNNGIQGLTHNAEANSYYMCQCYPLTSLLLSLNATQVDLMSIDVEFVEEEVIRSFDFESIEVKVIYIEWWLSDRLKWFIKYMGGKGYILADQIFSDIVLVKENSEYGRIVKTWPKKVAVIFNNQLVKERIE